jgi:hypothetical protein
MSQEEIKKCGRCNRGIYDKVFLYEVGYGPVHVLCQKLKIGQKDNDEEEDRKGVDLKKWL